MIRKKMVYAVVLAALLIACLDSRAEQNLGQQPNIGNAIWDKSVNGEENAQAYRDFWKVRILDYLARYPFSPSPLFCKPARACEQFIKKLTAGQFEVIAPNIFSPDQIKPVLDGGGADIEAKCPNYFFSVGSFSRNNDIFPAEKAPFLPTRNFAMYNLTPYFDREKLHGITGLNVIRAEYYYAYREETRTLTDKLMNWGGSALVTLPDCKVHGLAIAYSSTLDGRDIVSDPYPGIRELVLMDRQVYSLDIGHIRDRHIEGDMGNISLKIYNLSEQNMANPPFMKFDWLAK